MYFKVLRHLYWILTCLRDCTRCRKHGPPVFRAGKARAFSLVQIALYQIFYAGPMDGLCLRNTANLKQTEWTTFGITKDVEL
jgi:hypothetical protein